MIAIIGMTGCASTSTPTATNPPDAKPETVFEQPLAKTQQAAVDALTVVGCGIKKQEPSYVEGSRPHKMGLFVGSGGETIKITLVSLEPQKTSVTVKTEKSFVGFAGQKNWDKQVLEAMTKELNP